MHVDSTGTAAEMPAQLPSTVDTVPPVLNVQVAMTPTIGITAAADAQMTISIGQPTPATMQLPSLVNDVPPATPTVGITAVADAQTTISIRQPTPATVQLPNLVNNVPPVISVAMASTVGNIAISDAQTTTSAKEPAPSAAGPLLHPPAQLAPPVTPFHQELKEAEFLQLQSIQTSLQQSSPLFYKPTGQNWNVLSGYNTPGHGGNEYNFNVPGFNDGFGGHGVQGYNILTGPAQDAWLLAQNPDGTLFDTDNWDFGHTAETNIPRPTDHVLPMPGAIQTGPESNSMLSIEQSEGLGTRIRKPTGRKEVVPLTGLAKSEDDGIPEWMNLALRYLKNGLGSKGWLDCVDAWAEFEKKVGLQNSTSVSTSWYSLGPSIACLRSFVLICSLSGSSLANTMPCPMSQTESPSDPIGAPGGTQFSQNGARFPAMGLFRVLCHLRRAPIALMH